MANITHKTIRGEDLTVWSAKVLLEGEVIIEDTQRRESMTGLRIRLCLQVLSF
jgi:hypothetical protein